MIPLNITTIDPRQDKIAKDAIERYSGSPFKKFQPYVLLTNFPQYVRYFAKSRNVEVTEGSMFKAAHCKKEKISILDFHVGSPAAALVVDICASLPFKAALLLGMCGGLRKEYQIGDYFVPIASIRGEGTSDFYFPPEVPALSNFLVQRTLSGVLDKKDIKYHIGITHTTNKRFWEFNKEFREKLKMTRPQSIEMECATMFAAGYHYKLPIGALLLISDLPLEKKGIKTKKSSEYIFEKYTKDHVELGITSMKELAKQLKAHPKGVYRGLRRRFEKKREI